jgi:rhamnulokinase
MNGHVAIDLGAGSGRVFLGRLDDTRLGIEEVHRFQYAPGRVDGHLRWDAVAIFDGIRHGLAGAHVASGGTLDSVGADTWGVDYGLLDEGGRLLEDPVCYRDERTDGIMEEVFRRVPRDEIFARTGIQFHQLNTLYQLVAHVKAGLPANAARLLLMPDLCHHFLCGNARSEATIASTTQMLDVKTRQWDTEIFARLGLPLELMAEIVPAGTHLGEVRRELAADLGGDAVPVVAPAAHDTASAVAGTPLRDGWAFVSSGTWSLVGVERATPLVSPEIARANFTNEGGAFGTVRFLKNVMGLWLLESCRKEWPGQEWDALLAEVDRVRGFVGFVFPDSHRFFNPESMVREVREALTETDQPAPDDPVLLAKVLLDSLALRYASVVGTIEHLTGRRVAGLHIVGGGSRNDYLNQAAASATGRPVLAGPVEATVVGNVLVQAIATGRLASLEEGRRMVAATYPPRRFEPRDEEAWAEARGRYREIEMMT